MSVSVPNHFTTRRRVVHRHGAAEMPVIVAIGATEAIVDVDPSPVVSASPTRKDRGDVVGMDGVDHCASDAGPCASPV